MTAENGFPTGNPLELRTFENIGTELKDYFFKWNYEGTEPKYDIQTFYRTRGINASDAVNITMQEYFDGLKDLQK